MIIKLAILASFHMKKRHIATSKNDRLRLGYVIHPFLQRRKFVIMKSDTHLVMSTKPTWQCDIIIIFGENDVNQNVPVLFKIIEEHYLQQWHKSSLYIIVINMVWSIVFWKIVTAQKKNDVFRNFKTSLLLKQSEYLF